MKNTHLFFVLIFLSGPLVAATYEAETLSGSFIVTSDSLASGSNCVEVVTPLTGFS